MLLVIAILLSYKLIEKRNSGIDNRSAYPFDSCFPRIQLHMYKYIHFLQRCKPLHSDMVHHHNYQYLRFDKINRGNQRYQVASTCNAMRLNGASRANYHSDEKMKNELTCFTVVAFVPCCTWAHISIHLIDTRPSILTYCWCTIVCICIKAQYNSIDKILILTFVSRWKCTIFICIKSLIYTKYKSSNCKSSILLWCICTISCICIESPIPIEYTQLYSIYMMKFVESFPLMIKGGMR